MTMALRLISSSSSFSSHASKLSIVIISSATGYALYGRSRPLQQIASVRIPSSFAPFNICSAEWLPRVAITKSLEFVDAGRMGDPFFMVFWALYQIPIAWQALFYTSFSVTLKSLLQAENQPHEYILPRCLKHTEIASADEFEQAPVFLDQLHQSVVFSQV